MEEFCRDFRVTQDTHILDVGGSPHLWNLAPIRPNVVLLNIKGRADVISDAACLPFRDGQFDICFSNSVIEHVPVHLHQRMAEEIRRVSRSYYVQTPNFWFPIEPHFLALGLHWIPRKYRTAFRWIGLHWWITRPPKAEAKQLLEEITLLRRTDLETLFPDATIKVERVLGLPKSFSSRRLSRLP